MLKRVHTSVVSSWEKGERFTMIQNVLLSQVDRISPSSRGLAERANREMHGADSDLKNGAEKGS